MDPFQIALTALSAVAVFLHALSGFSRELRAAGGASLDAWLGRTTASRWRGFAAGALATAVIQSSSAVTAMAVALVHAGAISFRGSLAVLLGANVGTTSTAWLVSFKLTGMGQVFIVAGLLASLLPWRARVLGKAAFYFGLIFFSLDLVAGALRPLQGHPVFQGWLAHAQDPWAGVLFGLVVTLLLQSSSVTTGLAILFVQQGLLPAEAAIPVAIGAVAGTTSTALLASLGLGPAARATATANFLFNTAGVLVCLPFLGPYARLMAGLGRDPAQAVALAHLGFVACVALAWLLVLPRLGPWLAQRLDVPWEPGTRLS